MVSPTLTLLLMVALALAVTALLCWPWFRAVRDDGPDREAINVAVYRSRLAELEADVAAGVIDAESADQARAEQEARLLDDAQGDSLPMTRRRQIPLWILVLLLPVFAGIWYAAEGRWGMAQEIERARIDPVVNQRLAFDHGITQLQKLLAENPDDAESWARLGRSMLAVNRPNEAVRAYARATALVPDQPDWWAAEGEALAALQNQDLRGAPAARFERALALAPAHGKGLFYGGLAAAQGGDFATARERWSVLIAQPDLPESVRGIIEEGLSQWSGESSAEGPLMPPQPASPPVAGVRVVVELDLDARHRAALDQRPFLLVFARAADGPPMPLAVQRLTAPSFPLTVTLSEADAMMPTLTLANFEQYEIVARLSTGGDVSARPGDVEGRISVSRTAAGEQRHRLVLDSIVAP